MAASSLSRWESSNSPTGEWSRVILSMFPMSKKIEPRVTNMPHSDLVFFDQCDGGDACHSGPFRVAGCGLEDLRAGKRECFLDALVAGAGAAGEPCGDDVHRNFCGALAGCVPTEPVHNQKNAALRIDEVAIFVLGSLPPYVGIGRLPAIAKWQTWSSLCGARTPTAKSPRRLRAREEMECEARTEWRSRLCLEFQRAHIGKRDPRG